MLSPQFYVAAGHWTLEILHFYLKLSHNFHTHIAFNCEEKTSPIGSQLLLPSIVFTWKDALLPFFPLKISSQKD